MPTHYNKSSFQIHTKKQTEAEHVIKDSNLKRIIEKGSKDHVAEKLVLMKQVGEGKGLCGWCKFTKGK